MAKLQHPIEPWPAVPCLPGRALPHCHPAFSFLVCLRLLFAALPLSGQNLLKHDHQLSSPLTSYLRLKEGLWLLDNNIDPYTGGSFHHSPLLLSLFSTIVPPLPIIWAISDAVGAWALTGSPCRRGMHYCGRKLELGQGVVGRNVSRLLIPDRWFINTASQPRATRPHA
ncbi:GPI transamidase subunit PIG-U-domain-containing protein [Suillus fuscotomentosus]|uniref:GPI transamidase subunit PIG-U-domain-containing protein n=1 Tax=Suillus fuscotomentosus TaxID=1912939 RepID=A0AAD4EK90_9AGAM|nr:GPI transamidase subunit PIG-U-domain-containing protein [Suillus fuscotomentosus]KAG1906528.1 GPI transamidase subunit PIG-U-domain-containing protein [Suillus fuscotomentosus]